MRRLRWILAVLSAIAWPAQAEEPFSDCPACPELVWLGPGAFTMGSPSAERQVQGVPFGSLSGEAPQRRIRIGYRFALATAEVTVGEYAAFVERTGHASTAGCDVYWNGDIEHRPDVDWRRPGFPQDARHPVVCVSWDDAQAYAGWLAGVTGMAYRLPSEAEWEFAARAGTAGARFWEGLEGDACRYANVLDLDFDEGLDYRIDAARLFACRDRHVHTAPVRGRHGNVFGLYDMLGNVAEWVEDCYFTYRKAPTDGRSHVRAGCKDRVVRGGGWNDWPGAVRAAFRRGIEPAGARHNVGFRIVRSD